MDSRASQKIRYALVHLAEIGSYERPHSNDDFVNAHQESIYYHLVGAIESLLHEINQAYSLGMELSQVNWNSTRSKLKMGGHQSGAFDHLDSLRTDRAEWLSLLFEWRNYGAHRGRFGKAIYVSVGGGDDVRFNDLMDPRTGKPQEVYPGLKEHAICERLCADVQNLIECCRKIDSKLPA